MYIKEHCVVLSHTRKKYLGVVSKSLLYSLTSFYKRICRNRRRQRRRTSSCLVVFRCRRLRFHRRLPPHRGLFSAIYAYNVVYTQWVNVSARVLVLSLA